jgi:hypothetical protein
MVPFLGEKGPDDRIAEANGSFEWNKTTGKGVNSSVESNLMNLGLDTDGWKSLYL